MKFGVDWVSTGIFLAAYLFSRIPGVPPRVGFFAIAAACGGIVFYRYRMGGIQGPNLIFVGVAAALGLYYVLRALVAPARRAPKNTEDVE